MLDVSTKLYEMVYVAMVKIYYLYFINSKLSKLCFHDANCLRIVMMKLRDSSKKIIGT